ncbi:Panacea domain-containing protein [Candidatus Phytoplasma sp. AldY-WA1]|uniref:Panacea domain-containing protein n=1 Tax=Candidatus Phytoplasma sp. AldY-WA1 TaxID=2852100 RepID=UPI002550E1CB|nr:type II toxin-antitoxin system antitoxin SocA domain-containing protein [Candidatus Phytoplasma sp. AldY-WA1]
MKNQIKKRNINMKEPNFENILFTMANYIIKKDSTITNLKLQKILYYIHAHYLVKNKKDSKKDLFPNCSIHAWIYGPVFPNLYFKLAQYGDDPVKLIKENEFISVKLTKEQIESIEYILNKYGNMKPFELSSKTHQEDPWINNFEDDFFDPSDNIISEKDIFEYYTKNPSKL